MKVTTPDGVHFHLVAETVADQQLVDAIDFIGHVSLVRPIRESTTPGTWCNVGCELLVAHDDERKLVADASRKMFSGLGDLLRLALAHAEVAP